MAATFWTQGSLSGEHSLSQSWPHLSPQATKSGTSGVYSGVHKAGVLNNYSGLSPWIPGVLECVPYAFWKLSASLCLPWITAQKKQPSRRTSQWTGPKTTCNHTDHWCLKHKYHLETGISRPLNVVCGFREPCPSLVGS